MTFQTSGVLRDATTGAPIRHSCVTWRSRSATSNGPNVSNVHEHGDWSITSEDPGPYYVAFYVTADGDCGKAILTGPENYRASWYRAKPFTGTDPNTTPPPAEADLVAAGSNIVACLAKQDVLPTKCAIPNATVSGRVEGFGPVPIFQACVVALGPEGHDLGVTMSDANGRWTLTGLPINYDFIIGVIPPFRGSRGPCDSDGPPPVPPPGGLQPEFYDDTWADLSDQSLIDNAFAWATDPDSPHPAVVIRNSRSGLYTCLTTETGRDTVRGSCDPTSPTPTAPRTRSTGSALAATGGPSPLGPALGAVLVVSGVALLRRSRSIGRSRSDRGRHS